MERRPRDRYGSTRYPTRNPSPSRRSVLAGIGTAVGALAISAVTKGCLPPGNDDDDDTSGLLECTLPAADSRTVYIDYGSIDYHVALGVDDPDLYDFVLQQSGALTDAIDVLLANHDIYTFAPGETLTDIETAIAQLVADTYAGVEGAPLDDFAYVYLSIDHYDEAEDIAGMDG
jgi:hypothetical protein